MSDHIFYPFVLLFLVTSFALVLFTEGESSTSKAAEPVSPWNVSANADATASYRFTSNGWENATHWRVDQEESKARFFDRIHPLALSLLLVLIVYGLAILVTDESQLRRLWSRS